MGEPVSAGIRIKVVSAVGAADPMSTAALQHRLAEQAPGRERWGEARSVPRSGGPGTQGAVSDIVLDFVTGQLAPDLIKDAVKAGAAYLVWTVVSHLRSQPEPTQKIVLSRSDTDHDAWVEVGTRGLSHEETDQVRRALERIIERSAARQRREAEAGDED